MLLDLKFEITVTNNGVDKNNTGVSVDMDTKLMEVLTAIELARKNLESAVQAYLMSKPECKEMKSKALNKYLNSLTFKEVYETVTTH